MDALNARAVERGLSPLTDEDTWEGLSEEAIYNRLGLPFIAPELREGVAVLERADAGRLPPILSQTDYQGDLHCHTTESDGRHTLEEMAEAAIARGYRYLAITDHSRSTVIANGLSIERLLAQVEAVRELNRRLEGKLTLLAGSEVDILRDGQLDYPDTVLSQLDWVVASVHAHFALTEAAQTARICKAMENPYVCVLGHPTGRLLGRRDPYAVNISALIEKAAETGVALELNASPERLDLNAVYLAQAREADVPISLNTDAHSRDSFDFIRYGLMTARRAWLEPRFLVNWWDLEQVRAFRRS
jgi:DNA polymerase (family 10)